MQYLIDTYTVEGVNTLNRYVNADGVGVHPDLDGRRIIAGHVADAETAAEIEMVDVDTLRTQALDQFQQAIEGIEAEYQQRTEAARATYDAAVAAAGPWACGEAPRAGAGAPG